MTGRTAFINARLLDPASGLDARGAVLVEAGKIVDIGAGLFAGGVPDGVTVIDCGGHCLAPGLVDMRVELGEPGGEHKETLDSGARAAAAGGVTAMACLPNTDPPIDNVAVVEFVARRAREVKLAKIFAYGAITRGLKGEQLTEMGLLREAGAVGFTDGTHAVANARVMRRALTYGAGFGLLMVQHPEDPDLAGGSMTEGALATRLGIPGVPVAAEVMMVERDMHLVEMSGGRYHAAHVSTGAALKVLANAKARGLKVTADTAPPYFGLSEDAIDGYRTFAKLSPPLRSAADREAVIAALADGTIDVIASDHSPHDQESKRAPFVQAEPGIVGLETLLPLSLALVHDGRLPLLDLLAKLTCNPAKLLGLPLGTLAKGKPADLVLFDLDARWVIDTEKFRSKSKNSPFDGHEVRGRVLRTVVDGRTVFEAAA